MANPQNIKPISSTEEAREKGRKGGKKSGEVRRAKKTLREIADDLLAKDVRDLKQIRRVSDMGYDDTEINNAVLLVVSLFKRACLGDVAAIREYRSLIGEDAGADVMKKLDEMLRSVEKDA